MHNGMVTELANVPFMHHGMVTEMVIVHSICYVMVSLSHCRGIIFLRTACGCCGLARSLSDDHPDLHMLLGMSTVQRATLAETNGGASTARGRGAHSCKTVAGSCGRSVRPFCTR